MCADDLSDSMDSMGEEDEDEEDEGAEDMDEEDEGALEVDMFGEDEEGEDGDLLHGHSVSGDDERSSVVICTWPTHCGSHSFNIWDGKDGNQQSSLCLIPPTSCLLSNVTMHTAQHLLQYIRNFKFPVWKMVLVETRPSQDEDDDLEEDEEVEDEEAPLGGAGGGAGEELEEEELALAQGGWWITDSGVTYFHGEYH